MMMEKKEQAEMVDVTVANIAVNRKTPDELFVRIIFFHRIALFSGIYRLGNTGYPDKRREDPLHDDASRGIF
jgi:hypothetical protein